MSKPFTPFEAGGELLARFPLPVIYRYIEVVDPTREVHIGFIAQDIEQIDPRFVSYEAVPWSKERALHINYESMIALLFNTVRDQGVEIARLRSIIEPTVIPVDPMKTRFPL